MKVVVTATGWAIGYGIVAQGGGNIVAQGGGNIVAQGGGNLIEDGAAYLRSLTFTDSLTAARTAVLVTPGGASIISQDGNGFLPAMNQVVAIARLIGENSSGIIGENSSGIVGFNGSGVTASNSGASLLSVSSAKAAVITGPATWTYGQPAMITWTPTPGTAACAAGYEVLINGTPMGNAVTLTLGKSLLQPGTWPRGTKLSVALTNLCNGTTVASLHTTTIQ